MFKELTKFIQRCYDYAEKYAKTYSDIEQWRGQAFGALEFAIENKLVDEDDATEYWKEMWKKFHDLSYRQATRSPFGPAAEIEHMIEKNFF